MNIGINSKHFLLFISLFNIILLEGGAIQFENMQTSNYLVSCNITKSLFIGNEAKL